MAGGETGTLRRLAIRIVLSLAGVAAFTGTASALVPVNATTAGFGYLLLVLVIASIWGFVEALVASAAATLFYNFFFLPPIGTLTIADPQNWVALFSFFITSLIASRLSTKAKRRAADALERQQDVERLYTFSRAILLIGRDEAFPNQLIRSLAEIFELTAVVLYDRRSGEFYRAGPADFEGIDDQLRDAALQGSSYSDTNANRTITAIRLGSEPIASLALQGARMQDPVLQGVGNLVAIGLERAKAQDLAHQVEAARQSEQLRTTIIDAMAHEFKTPLTLIKGATSAILAADSPLPESAREQLTIADEEAEHLRELLDNAIEMARLDTTHIEVHLELSAVEEIAREALASLQTEIDSRPAGITPGEPVPPVPLDRRLVRLALKQLVDNALKYSPPESAVAIRIGAAGELVTIDVTDHGPGISAQDQSRIFERFYRGQSVRSQIPGSGLGLTIATAIARAHRGDLTVTSRPGETTFRMTLPRDRNGREHN